jgi:hypothetical protein
MLNNPSPAARLRVEAVRSRARSEARTAESSCNLHPGATWHYIK